MINSTEEMYKWKITKGDYIRYEDENIRKYEKMLKWEKRIIRVALLFGVALALTLFVFFLDLASNL